ncbi:hypothetical protein BDV34DRAFT_97554 [Aspergillus parasiticus]|uniref:Uncharacterized protein n=1 Tax=Aspergillus parasiticus TaxID=5067 RepID=A0A5N6DL02_ASPPA|nr:hypothetical protein BDV34DRAFT_97554 [Aspergillus parasiticus]
MARWLHFQSSCPSYAATTRFDIPLQGATVLDTGNDFLEFTASHQDINFETVKGGHTINEPNGRILAYVGDDLGKQMTERMKPLNLFEKLLAERDVSEKDISNIFEIVRGWSNPICVYPGVLGK